MSDEENPEVAEETAPVVKDEQNGVTRPKKGTKTGIVWEVADELSAKAEAPAFRKDVIAKCIEEDINPSTAATQYGRWRKYHGLTGTGHPAKAEAAPADEPESEAEVQEEE